MQVLAYCADAARAGMPLSTVEIIDDSGDTDYRILGVYNEDSKLEHGDEGEATCGWNWNELYRDLQVGFVYEGVLYNNVTAKWGYLRLVQMKSRYMLMWMFCCD